MRMNLLLFLLAGCAFGATGRLASTWRALGAGKEHLARERERGHRLDEEVATSTARAARYARIRQGVAEGRLTLDRGVEALLAEEAARPRSQRILCGHLPGSTHDERFCRHLIEWVKVKWKGGPRLSPTLARLEDQLQRRLARLGRLSASAGTRHRPSHSAPLFEKIGSGVSNRSATGRKVSRSLPSL
jgi:hypothetical protein